MYKQEQQQQQHCASLAAGGHVFPPARLPAVPECLPGRLRERQTRSAYAVVPRSEHRDRRESFGHGGGGGYVRVGHVRQPVRAQLQRLLAIHQRGSGSLLTNGKARKHHACLFVCWFVCSFVYCWCCMLMGAADVSQQNKRDTPVNV